MFGRQARAAAREQAQQQARAQAEADALFAQADQLDDLAIGPRGYRQQITAARAARIRELLGPDLARDASAAADHERLQGTDLDAEIDRLAEMFPEPQTAGPGLDEAAARAERARLAERRAAAAEQAALRAGEGQPSGPAWQHLQDARQARRDAEADTYASAARLQQEAEGDSGREPPDHLYDSPECAEADSETAHFGWAARELQDAGAWPQPRPGPMQRMLVSPAANPVPAALACDLPDGTPHADPFLAGRGWQARHGVYVRQPQAQLEAG